MGRQTSRPFSSEIATAMVQVSQNLGMGSAAIGLGGAGIGIGLVFAALLMAVARNPSMRGQLFSYAILGFAFVEAIGLFDLMVAMVRNFCHGSAQKCDSRQFRNLVQDPRDGHLSISFANSLPRCASTYKRILGEF